MTYVPEHSLTTLNAVHVPDGVDDPTVPKRLLNEFGIEIGSGLGPFKGKAWRVGLMGHSSAKRNVMLVLSALESLLLDQGADLKPAKPCRRHQEFSRPLNCRGSKLILAVAAERVYVPLNGERGGRHGYRITWWRGTSGF